ncbi:MAG: hypothetical protein ACK4M9_22020 [Anaerobacillus sp.]|uniref:hypothetical protein n=1 Tax=Anaerobacillus sp. TaxID=1872506 RepID=UPI00391B7C44
MDKKTKKVSYLIGLLIFGGWFITSLIEAANEKINYSTYTVWEFRFFIIGCAAIYYLVIYYFSRKAGEAVESTSSGNQLKRPS